MLGKREVATILPALLHRHEETCPHGPSTMRPYFKALGLPRANGQAHALVPALVTVDAATICNVCPLKLF
jgi:hypothetical protein